MRIALIGAGAKGCTYGGLLVLGGHDVWLVTRRASQAQTLKTQGLCIEGPMGERVIEIQATADPREAGEVDLICICVKSYATAAAAEMAGPMVGPNTTVVTFQVGLNNVETLGQVLGDERVILGVSYVRPSRISDRRVTTGAVTRTVLGELDGRKTERLERIVRAFERAGIETEISDNVFALMWEKILIMAGQEALAAITGLRSDELLANPMVDKILEPLLSEVVAVAKILGVELEDPVAALKNYWASQPPHKAATLEDIEAGRLTEIDTLNGAIAHIGDESGVATPYNELLTFLVKVLEEATARR